MPRLEGIREKLQVFEFDTVFASEYITNWENYGGNHTAEVFEFNSFDSIRGDNLLYHYRAREQFTSLRFPNELDRHHTVIIQAFMTQVWFEGEEDKVRPKLDAIEIGTHFKPIINSVHYPAIPLFNIMDKHNFLLGEDKEGGKDKDKGIMVDWKYAFSPNRRTYWCRLAKDFHIHRNSRFNVSVKMNDYAHEAATSFKGRKMMRMWVGGMKVRDVQ